MSKKKTLPPKPECGSIEKNKMLRAFNKRETNPCTENQACIDWWNDLVECSERAEKKYGSRPYYDLVEPDAYEDAKLEQLI